jgi:hypothetical protein
MLGRCVGLLRLFCWGRCLSRSLLPPGGMGAKKLGRSLLPPGGMGARKLGRSLLPPGGMGARKLGSFPLAVNVPDATTAMLAKAKTCVSLRLVGFP